LIREIEIPSFGTQELDSTPSKPIYSASSGSQKLLLRQLAFTQQASGFKNKNK